MSGHFAFMYHSLAYLGKYMLVKREKRDKNTQSLYKGINKWLVVQVN